MARKFCSFGQLCASVLAGLAYLGTVNAEGWIRNPLTNCWAEHGAVDLETSPGAPCGVMDIEACYAKCNDLANCQGVTVKAAIGKQVKCFRRGNISITDCDQGTQYDTWVKALAPPPGPATTKLSHTVSGFSSGASMAMIHFVAFSASVLGVGVIAGSPYGCNILPDYGYTCSMPRGASLPWAQYIDQCYGYIRDRAGRGIIDPIPNMKGKPVYLYSGMHDDVVDRQVMVAVDSQLRNLTSNISVLTRFDVPSEHGFIVDDTTCANPSKQSKDAYCGPKPGPSPGHGGTVPGGCCGACNGGQPFSGNPWWRPPINNCKYDMAGDLLQHLLPGLTKRTASKQENLVPIDQARFIPANATLANMQMDPVAFLYVPTACRGSKSSFKCRVHVHYHCCSCSWRVNNMGTSYVAQTGLNEWAEANDIVVFYPQAADYPDTNDGCWDWDGSYVGPNFDTQEGLQLRTVINIVNHVPDIVASLTPPAPLAKIFL